MARGQRGEKEGLENWTPQISGSPLVQEGVGCWDPRGPSEFPPCLQADEPACCRCVDADTSETSEFTAAPACPE